MGNIKFAIFGDCGSQGIVDDREHTRAVGFINWYSLLSEPIMDEKMLESAESIGLSGYSIRNLQFDLKKIALEYLLAEKADYLLLDPNDCRMEIASINGKSYTISKAGAELYNENNENEINCGKNNASDIPLEEYEKAVRMVCNQIKKVYDTSEIILHEHHFVTEYTDGSRIMKLNNEKFSARKKAVQDVLKNIYGMLHKELQGCHVIEFHDYVLADSRHRWGLCGLHYHNMYYEYGKKAIQIICEKHPDEELLLKSLKDNYSLKFQILRAEIENNYRFSVMETRLNNLVKYTAGNLSGKDLKDIFQGIKDIKSYIDAICLHMHNIGVYVAVKDTPGFVRAGNYHNAFKDIGFEKYPDKLWYTYCGFILKGVIIIDLPSESAEVPTIWSGAIHNHSIHLESHSWRKQNLCKIMIDDAEYSTNARGANIVIIDADTFEVIDSVVYDTHEQSDKFRRVKKI